MEKTKQIENPEETARYTDRTLFLPVGSIRALVMLTLLASSIIFIHNNVVTPEWFNSLTIAAFAYYFGSKNGVRK